MSVLARYSSKEFLKLMAICQTFFVVIFLIIDFLQKIDNFMEAHVVSGSIFAYFLYKIPYIIVQMVPVSALIAVIIMFSLMKKYNELIALKSCGISMFNLSWPVLLISVSLSLMLFLLSELVVPYTSSKSQDIWIKEVEKRDPKRFYGRDNIWYRGHQTIFWLRHFDEKRKMMENPTFYFFDDSFHLVKMIVGQRAIWTGQAWKVEDGAIQEAEAGQRSKFYHFKEMELKLEEKPEAFLKTIKRPEEMSYWQLKRFAKKVRYEGYDANRYLVDMNIKLAFPMINLIMVIIGLPLAVGLKKGGTPLAVSLGIGLCFLYLLSLGIFRSLGLSGILPPILAAWLANLIFLLIGIYLIIYLED